jgi:heme-binding protein
MKIVKILKWLVLILAIVFIAIQFKRPARTNPPVEESQTLAAHTQMTPEVADILARSCYDCHSNRTTWPWYTNVAPISWFIVDHVNEGRADLNFSEWGKYEQRRQDRRLQQMCDLAQDASMPLTSYTPLHSGSKLTPAQVKTLCDWTKAERARLSGK